MFGNTVNTTSLLVNVVIINPIKATQSNVLIWKFKKKRERKGRCRFDDVQSQTRMHLHSGQWRAKQQKISVFELRRGCRCVWHVNKRRTLHLNVTHVDDHAPSVVEWRCVTALLTKLYKLKFFHNTIMKWNKTY